MEDERQSTKVTYMLSESVVDNIARKVAEEPMEMENEWDEDEEINSDILQNEEDWENEGGNNA